MDQNPNPLASVAAPRDYLVILGLAGWAAGGFVSSYVAGLRLSFLVGMLGSALAAAVSLTLEPDDMRKHDWRLLPRAVREGSLGAFPVGLAGGIIAGLKSKPEICEALGGFWGAILIGCMVAIMAGFLGGLREGRARDGAILAGLVWLAFGFFLMARFDEW
jgi:hypothetical protein